MRKLLASCVATLVLAQIHAPAARAEGGHFGDRTSHFPTKGAGPLIDAITGRAAKDPRLGSPGHGHWPKTRVNAKH